MSRAKNWLVNVHLSQHFYYRFFLFQKKSKIRKVKNFFVPSLERIEFLKQTLIFQIVFGFVPSSFRGEIFLRLENFCFCIGRPQIGSL